MWKKLKKKIAALPAPLRNPYLLLGFAFAVWMLFVDENNLYSQYKRHRNLSELLEKKAYLEEQIKDTDNQLAELTSNPATQEKFAREHYHMKRDNEDVFVIVPKP